MASGDFRLNMATVSFLVLVIPVTAGAQRPANYVAGSLVQLNDNGAWSWFTDERVLVDQGKLIVGSVRSLGDFNATQTQPDWGNVEVSVYDIATGRADHAVLDRHFEEDDHDAPAFLALPDGRYLAVYTKHGVERRISYRFSPPGEPLTWGDAQVFDTPGTEKNFAGDNATYSNLFRLPDGRIYDFFRGIGHEPNYIYSDDDGKTWAYGGHVLRGKGGYSPYLKYAFDGKRTIHFIATEDHPRNYDNSIYHGFVRDGKMHGSDGKVIAKLSTSTEASLAAWDLTKVYQGDPDNVAWTVDIELDDYERPYIAFSVQKDGRGLPPRQGGMDLRYDYGRWDGTQWHVHEMAYAGTRLYPYEDDYSGLVALDPQDPDTVFISTNADPATGTPLISPADGRRHYEIFRGETSDRGAHWHWLPITANSTVDNLRPLVPKWKDARTALVWMRGPSYTNYHGNWTTAVVAVILPPNPK
ncbi:MAG: BNR repeat-containing protein [Acidobacteriia bacterium]|nr:BNR repeat-containing protein [Terriglobia bacterium]